jgi:hypothetical protein
MKHLEPPDLRSVAAGGSYVYCYLRSSCSKTAKTGTPYYIGIASSADRPLHKNHNAPVPLDNSLIRVMRHGLTWEQATFWERFYIARYGRKDKGTGILLNLTDGGEGAKGAIRTQQQRENYRAASTGRRHSEEAKKKLSLHRIGKPLTEATKEKISQKLRGRVQSEEWVEKRTAAHRGAIRSDATREKIRDKAIGRKSPSVAQANSRRIWDDAARLKHSQAMKQAAARRKDLTTKTSNDS